MDKQAREARKMAKELPFREKVAHIWMYYKNWIIGSIIAAILIGTTAYQMVTRPSYDLELNFYSDKMLSEESVAALEQYIAGFVEDVDGDGEVTVKIYTNFASILGGGAEGTYAIQTKLMSELTAGEYSIYLFDESYSEQMTQGMYEGCMESMRNVSEVPELQALLKLPEGTNIYWGTRSLYETESEKEEKILAHDRAVAVEEAIFGER